MEYKNDLIAFAVLIALVTVMASFYYKIVLEPRDEALYQIMDCMGPDNSRSAYDACVTQLRPR